MEQKKSKRGRPRGRTQQGEERQQLLYETAIRMIADKGYDATTLREIAKEAGVSVGLLYRYFPNKRAVVLKLYDELSTEYAKEALEMPKGNWGERSLFALRTSLKVLGPHKKILSSLIPILVGNREDGLFAPNTEFSRIRVQNVFIEAVLESNNAPEQKTGAALGRLLYFVHLAILLWWLMDKSPSQRATRELLSILDRSKSIVSFALRIPWANKLILSADTLCREALFGENLET